MSNGMSALLDLFITSAKEQRLCNRLRPSVVYLTVTRIFLQLPTWLVQNLPCTFKLPTKEIDFCDLLTRPTFQFSNKCICWPLSRKHTLFAWDLCALNGEKLDDFVDLVTFPLTPPSGHMLATLEIAMSLICMVQCWLWKYQLTWKTGIGGDLPSDCFLVIKCLFQTAWKLGLKMAI